MSVEMMARSVGPGLEGVTPAIGLWAVKAGTGWMRGGLCPKVECTMPGGRPTIC